MNGKSFVRVEAPAKVNLYLHVTGLRDDGFHELDSLVVFADVHDLITCKKGSGLTLKLSGPESASLRKASGTNIVLRAAKALADKVGPNKVKGVEIHLEKFLPVAAGIGGGSADAAATLKALCEFWDVNLSQREISELAQFLGADVAVCVEGWSSFFSGIGDKIDPINNFPKLSMLLVNPGVELLTSNIFKARKGSYTQMARLQRIPIDSMMFFDEIKKRTNDLEATAIIMAPVIKQVLSNISSSPGCKISRMSGSGATCFGLFDNKVQAKKAALELRKMNPNWWIVATESRL